MAIRPPGLGLTGSPVSRVGSVSGFHEASCILVGLLYFLTVASVAPNSDPGVSARNPTHAAPNARARRPSFPGGPVSRRKFLPRGACWVSAGQAANVAPRLVASLVYVHTRKEQFLLLSGFPQRREEMSLPTASQGYPVPCRPCLETARVPSHSEDPQPLSTSQSRWVMSGR